jgi:hypothetical protein
MLSDNDKSELALFVAHQREHKLPQWAFAFFFGPANENGARNHMLTSWGRKMPLGDVIRNLEQHLHEMLRAYVGQYHELPTAVCLFIISDRTRLTNQQVADYAFDTMTVGVGYAPGTITDPRKWIDEVWLAIHDVRE